MAKLSQIVTQATRQFANLRFGTALDAVHDMIHVGRFFTASANDEALGAGADFDILLRGPSGSLGAHFRPSVAVGGDMRATLYRSPTTTDDGTPLVAANRNELSSRAAEMLAFVGPTVSAVGTQRGELLLPGGTGVFFSPGTTDGFFKEWILGDFDYLVRINNLTASPQIVSVALDWYEPTPD